MRLQFGIQRVSKLVYSGKIVAKRLTDCAAQQMGRAWLFRNDLHGEWFGFRLNPTEMLTWFA